jgi:tetratricopeptide (TPR) repeat protein
MNELVLQREVSDYEELFSTFESLVKDRAKFYLADDHLATALCELYAIMGAYQIRACIGSSIDIEIVPAQEENEDDFGAREVLPKYETVQRAGQEMLAAVATGDKAAVLGALKEMGVSAQCPTTERLFSRMELVAERVAGHAQQVFLVELSRFAANAGEYERASKFIQKARIFDPSSWELYNVCVVEGLIALNDGRVDEAVQCLAHSISACLAYEKARVQCCVRAPNLELAAKLLERGERVEVLRHLADCKNVWEVLQPQIDSWIHAIDSGEKPDFLATGNLRVPEKPSHRLRMQWMNACSLASGPVSSAIKQVSPKTPAERLVARERWMARNGPRLDAFIKKELEYLEKDMADSPDQPPSNPADPSQPSSSEPAV